MTRVILVPADLSGAPLAELKQWLAISSTADDAALTALLHAALAPLPPQLPLPPPPQELPVEACARKLWVEGAATGRVCGVATNSLSLRRSVDWESGWLSH